MRTLRPPQGEVLACAFVTRLSGFLYSQAVVSSAGRQGGLARKLAITKEGLGGKEEFFTFFFVLSFFFSFFFSNKRVGADYKRDHVMSLWGDAPRGGGDEKDPWGVGGGGGGVGGGWRVCSRESRSQTAQKHENGVKKLQIRA